MKFPSSASPAGSATTALALLSALLPSAGALAASPQQHTARQSTSSPGTSSSSSAPSKSQEEGTCSPPRKRVEWASLSGADRGSFVGAIRCLMDAPGSGVLDHLNDDDDDADADGAANTGTSTKGLSRYDELVWVHNNMTLGIHGTDAFLPWHRYYLHALESLLRGECGYPAASPFPWWDEVRSHADLGSSGLFTDEFFGALPPTPEVIPPGYQGTCLTKGIFGGLNATVGYPTPLCLSRAEDKSATGAATSEAVAKCQGGNGGGGGGDDKETRATTTDVSTYPGHRECVEGGIHADTHAGIGPIMANVAASPADPIFWMHHGMIDWQWARWQRVDRAGRVEKITGCATLPGDDGECPEKLTLDTVLSLKGVFKDMKVRDVMDTEGSPLCYAYDYY